VDRLVRTRASEQKPEELKISAVVDADTPPDPKRTTPPFLPSDRGGEFARGGKGSAGLVLVAQQNPVWTGAHDTPVKANFSSAQPRPPSEPASIGVEPT